MTNGYQINTHEYIRFMYLILAGMMLCVGYPVTFYYTYRLWSYRRHTVLAKRYINISFHQILWLAIIYLSDVSYYLFTLGELYELTPAEYAFNWLIFSIAHYLSYWMAICKFYMLFYDMQWLQACLSQRWHHVIRPTNTNTSKSTEILSIPAANLKDSEISAAIVNTTTTTSSRDHNGSSRSSNSVNRLTWKSFCYFCKKIVNIDKKVAFNDPNWFIEHKNTFGNLDNIVLSCYIFGIICVCIEYPVDYICTILINTVAARIVWVCTQFLLSCVILTLFGVLYYQIRTKLKFEDNFFVAAELSRFFWLFGIVYFSYFSSTILILAIYNGEIKSTLFEQILYLSYSYSRTFILFAFWLFQTQWLLNKTKTLLDDPKFYPRNAKNSRIETYYSYHDIFNSTQSHQRVVSLVEEITVPLIELNKDTLSPKTKAKKSFHLTRNLSVNKKLGKNSIQLAEYMQSGNSEEKTKEKEKEKKQEQETPRILSKNVKKYSFKNTIGSLSVRSPIFSGSSRRQRLNVKLASILSHTKAIDLFMQHLAKEFSIECLLSLIELSQFQKYVYERIERNYQYSKGIKESRNGNQRKNENENDDKDENDYDDDDDDYDDEDDDEDDDNDELDQFEDVLIENKYRIVWPESVPLSAIVFDDYWKEYEIVDMMGGGDDDLKKVQPNRAKSSIAAPAIPWIVNGKTKAFKLYCKYIATGSEYEINIASRTRRQLEEKMTNYGAWIGNEQSNNETVLFDLFNQCCIEMIYLLHGSFGRFKQSPNFTKLQSLVMLE